MEKIVIVVQVLVVLVVKTRLKTFSGLTIQLYTTELRPTTKPSNENCKLNKMQRNANEILHTIYEQANRDKQT